jgi:hypothetical protein
MGLPCTLSVDLRGGFGGIYRCFFHSTTADRNSTGFGGKIVENPVEDVEVFPPLRQKIDGVKGHAFACENHM